MKEKKIIIADDDRDDREIFERVLGLKPNITLSRSLENGREVIEYLEQLGSPADFPDLIVLDQNMPKMNGVEALEWISGQEKYKQITVVIYSTHSDNKLTARCIALGAKMVLTKPSTMKEYEETIDQFLHLVS